ncbi:MAG: c-type cytochrome domain-containing protein [Luteolibacter sp.]
MRSLFFIFGLSSILHAEEKISYDDHVFPIFEQSCLNCHNPDKTKGGLDLSSFSGTLKGGSSGKIVEPGDTSSTLIVLVRHTAEPAMPPEGEKLSPAQIDTLEKWIGGGLLENKSSKARKAEKPKFETTLSSDPITKPDGPPPMPQHLLLEPPVITARANAVHAITTSPWAPLLAVTSQNQILLYHTETLDLIGILPFPEGDPISLAFTPDARYLIVGGGIPGKNGSTITFDVTDGSRILTVAKEFDSILATDIRPSFDIVATGGPSKLLKIWNTKTGELTESIKKHTDWITALDISPDGKLIASADRNGGVQVWNAPSANELHTLRAHQKAITSLAFRSDSKLLASTSEDGTLRFWEMKNGREVKKIDTHKEGVTAFAFAKDGSFLTAGRDKKARLWKPDFKSFREIKLPSLPTAAAIGWEAKRAFVADAQGNIHRIDYTRKGDSKLTTFPANPQSIQTRLDLIVNSISELKKNPKNPESKIATLQARAKALKAAAINTQAITATAEAEARRQEFEDSITTFRDTLETLHAPAAALSKKRYQLNQFSIDLQSSPQNAEALASLSALDSSVKNHSEILQRKEQEIATLQKTITISGRSFAESNTRVEQLKQTYQDALK